MCIFENDIPIKLENGGEIIVYKNGKIEINWNGVISSKVESVIISRLNKFFPTKKRWNIKKYTTTMEDKTKITTTKATTELNSFEAQLLEANSDERERLRVAADVPIK